MGIFSRLEQSINIFKQNFSKLALVIMASSVAILVQFLLSFLALTLLSNYGNMIFSSIIAIIAVLLLLVSFCFIYLAVLYVITNPQIGGLVTIFKVTKERFASYLWYSGVNFTAMSGFFIVFAIITVIIGFLLGISSTSVKAFGLSTILFGILIVITTFVIMSLFSLSCYVFICERMNGMDAVIKGFYYARKRLSTILASTAVLLILSVAISLIFSLITDLIFGEGLVSQVIHMILELIFSIIFSIYFYLIYQEEAVADQDNFGKPINVRWIRNSIYTTSIIATIIVLLMITIPVFYLVSDPVMFELIMGSFLDSGDTFSPR